MEAQSVESVTTEREPSQAQIDPVLFGTYQEKLYVHVSLTRAYIFVSWFYPLLVSLY